MQQEAIDGFLEVNRWYKETASAGGIEVLNTSNLSPETVAERVSNWVDSH